MTPGAPHQPNSLTAGEQREPPYILAANKDRRSGQINVFLRTAVDEVIFRGFMIMAEVHGERGHGYFYPALQSKELAGTLDCAKLPATCPDPTRAACQGTANAITHNSNADKNNVTVIWTPPSKMAGEVVFRATIVSAQRPDSIYFEDVLSNPVTL